MDNFDLLEAVQPAGGWFCVAGIGADGSIRPKFVETRGEVTQVAERLMAQGRNVFFGVAKYATGENRTKDNVLALKAFWLDIDCGPDKALLNPKTGRPAGYASQAEGLTALRAFVQAVGLPVPTLVNSGRGVHVYWPLTEAVSREDWEPVASKLRGLCNAHRLYVDGSVFEVSRILRIPGTLNFKEDPPLPVTVLKVGKPTPLEHLKTVLGVEEVPQLARPKRELTALGKAMQSNVESNFTTIMRKCGKGEGCTQLLSCYMERAELAEPRWFDALSIAKFCSDKDTAIHKLSEGHPDYDPGAVERKTMGIKGPHSCAEFEKNNPGGCDGCPHYGKLTSPISLGKTIARSAPEPIEVVEEPDEESDEEPVVHTVPAYPDPFFRGKHGGVYFLSPSEDDAEPELVYEHDLYVVKRMRDPIQGDVAYLKVHMPMDGVKEFVLTNVQLADKAELRKHLAAQGVVCPEKRFQLLAMYLMTAVRDLQQRKKAELMRLQFGWADKDSKFIIGDREITRDGIFHSPVSLSTADVAQHMFPTGTLEKWKEVFSLYGREGLEPHAFATLTAFGAPLLKFLGQSGAIVNVIHPSSGTGKTTILHMCNSVYGHPQKLCATWADTLNAKLMKLGLLNNLPFCVDEMTNMTPQDFSTLAYSMSQGRGKDRVKSSANELRANLTTWATTSLCSSNSAFTEKMLTLKNSPDGELMRLIEYKIEFSGAIATDLAKEMFDHQLMENYGHAGDIYARWLVSNLEEAMQTCRDVQRKLDSELRLTQRERFWSAVVASNIAGGLIAKALGLIDWDMKRIYAWATSMVLALRTEVTPPVSEVSSVVGDFVNRHMQNIVVVNEQTDGRGGMAKLQAAPILEPRGPLLIRYEPDTKRMYINAKAFKRDCVDMQINYKDTLKQLETKGIYLGAGTKRMSKGMSVASPGVHAIELDCSNPDFISLSALIPGQPSVSGAS
jgi:hypothetical protein